MSQQELYGGWQHPFNPDYDPVTLFFDLRVK